MLGSTCSIFFPCTILPTFLFLFYFTSLIYSYLLITLLNDICRDNTELVLKLLQNLDDIKEEGRCQECREKKICLTCYKSSRGGNSFSPERSHLMGDCSPPRSGFRSSRHIYSGQYIPLERNFFFFFFPCSLKIFLSKGGVTRYRW